MILKQLHPSFYAPEVLIQRTSVGGTLSAWTTGLVYEGVEYQTQSVSDLNYEYPCFLQEGTDFLDSQPTDSVVLENGRLVRTEGFASFAAARFIRGNVISTRYLDFSTFSDPSPVYDPVGSVEGSYMRFSNDAVMAVLDVENKEIYQNGNRNFSSGWPHEKLTAIPFSCSRSGDGKLCPVAVTPRHCLTAKHYHPEVGDVITWKTLGNVSVSKTIIGYAAVDWNDLAMVILDSDLPASINPLPVVGLWYDFMDLDDGLFTPQHSGLFQDQNRQVSYFHAAHIAPISQLEYEGATTWNGLSQKDFVPGGTNFVGYPDLVLPDISAKSATFKSFGVAGDSGLACVVPIASGEWAVAGAFHFSGGGPFPHAQLLNSLISLLDSNSGISTGYTVTVAPDPTL